jgi:hypothetical protein
MHLSPLPTNDYEVEDIWEDVGMFNYRELKERLQDELSTISLSHSGRAARVVRLMLYVERRAYENTGQVI